ncbi:hypothetical protein [Hellea balneolensis]|uniref:hypothetical protein n=1 Tax=Hellea balneolensis TaxID=287478 RepID=UPI00138AB8FB|nr:hypothetical protein [Hellea balneolensis]
MKLNNAWNGYGSAIFLEFGNLSDVTKKNGEKSNNPRGEITIMIEWDWRAEKEASIICGSSLEGAQIELFLKDMLGSEIIRLQTTGRLPELEIEFSNKVTLKTFMTSVGQPEWAFMDDREVEYPSLVVEGGVLCAETDAENDN